MALGVSCGRLSLRSRGAEGQLDKLQAFGAGSISFLRRIRPFQSIFGAPELWGT